MKQTPIRFKNAVAVDASCDGGGRGRVWWRGVDLQTGEILFYQGPYEDGTNNIGEFLAVVHALALLDKREAYGYIVYTDSKVAISWVTKCHVKQKGGTSNPALRNLLTRAIIWLGQHRNHCRIAQWDTAHWGENPADFTGR